MDKSSIGNIAEKFETTGDVVECIPHGNGNVNDTFLIFCESQEGTHRYTLQRINHEVFKDPESLMENFSRVTSHLLLKNMELNQGYESLILIPTLDDKSFIRDELGNYWRMTEFIAGGRSFDVPENEIQAYEAAKAFGSFQTLLDDLPGPPLVETIPDFHNTLKRLEHFESAVRDDSCGRVQEVEDLVEFVCDRKNLARSIPTEEMPSRVVHNDTKLNNVLLHKETSKGMCVVDLDTVMPGCVLYDFGDLVRTAACSSDEDEINLEKVCFLPDTYESILKGYLETAGNMLEEKELDLLPVAPLVITYELGIRFLGDYINGDKYFKIKRPSHNLDRARTQFALLCSMEDNFENMTEINKRYTRDLSTVAS